MTVYIVMFLIAEFFAILAYSYKRGKEKRVFYGGKIHLRALYFNFFYFLTAVPFLMVAGLRYNVGTDYRVYSSMQIPMLLRGVDYKLKFEYLYQALIRFGMSLGNIQYVFIFTHILIILILWLHLRDYSLDIRLSIFIFTFGAYFNTSLNLMRQFIAISVVIYASKFIINRNFVKFLIFIAIAFMFHKTAILYLPFYFLSNIKINRKYLPFIMFVMFFASNYVRSLIIKFTNLVGLYANYFNSEFDVYNTQWDFFLLNFTVLIGAIYLTNYKIKIPNNFGHSDDNFFRYENFLFIMQFFATSVSALSSVIPNSTRIIFMFSICQVMYIPILLFQIDEGKKKFLASLIIVLFYLIVFARLIIYKNIGETLPYHFL